MPSDYLDELRALEKAATPGPRRWDVSSHQKWDPDGEDEAHSPSGISLPEVMTTPWQSWIQTSRPPTPMPPSSSSPCATRFRLSFDENERLRTALRDIIYDTLAKLHPDL